MLFLPARFPKNFTADRCNIMQEDSECLEVTHYHPNFTLGNQFKGIMKKNADAGKYKQRGKLPHLHSFKLVVAKCSKMCSIALHYQALLIINYLSQNSM